MKEINLHTVYNSEDCVWENRVNGVLRTTHKLKFLAVARARIALQQLESALEALGLKLEVEHFIHNKDGVVKEKNSYGNDPKEIKG